MMRRTPTGWVAQSNKLQDWPVHDGKAEGIYIYFNVATSTIQYAGPDCDPTENMLIIPNDASLLRELAQVFTELADYKKVRTPMQLREFHKRNED